MAPVPMPMSAYFWLWQMRPPERPTSALESMRAIILVLAVETPSARIMSSLLPVARSALPISVPKNQYSRAMMSTATIRPTMMEPALVERPVVSVMREKIVSCCSRGVLDLPIIRRLTDHRAICVRIPARIAGISNTVCKKPVTAPASIPASIAATIAIRGSTPATTSTAQTLPPSAKLPSTVRSAMSSSL